MSVCAGNADMIRGLGTIKGYYDYGMFQAIQIAAIVALRETEANVENQSMIYQGRRDVLVNGLRRLGWTVTSPKAGMFVWAEVPEPWRSSMSTMDFAMKLLEQGNVAVSPGSGFGTAGEGFLRMSLVENEQRLRRLFDKLENASSISQRPARVDGHRILTCFSGRSRRRMSLFQGFRGIQFVGGIPWSTDVVSINGCLVSGCRLGIFREMTGFRGNFVAFADLDGCGEWQSSRQWIIVCWNTLTFRP